MVKVALLYSPSAPELWEVDCGLWQRRTYKSLKAQMLSTARNGSSRRLNANMLFSWSAPEGTVYARRPVISDSLWRQQHVYRSPWWSLLHVTQREREREVLSASRQTKTKIGYLHQSSNEVFLNLSWRTRNPRCKLYSTVNSIFIKLSLSRCR